MEREELIKKYINFFKSKGHKEIPNAGLIPKNDPTTLFISAGMQPLAPYFLGQKSPLGKRLTNIQKCVRTIDIEEVGDSYHHTFFEMLGNWSLGDYFKKESIKFSFEFLTKILKIPTEKLAVTCFKGDTNYPKDEESAGIWESLGIQKEKIVFLGKEENWWGPVSKTGPCGPDTEIFYWKLNKPAPKKFNPNDKNWVEIWNNVLMEYYKNKEGYYEKAFQKNIDTGMGVERTIAVLNGLEDNYLTNIFKPIIKKIEILSNKKYGINEKETKSMRIIADHLKASVFILSENTSPSNTEQGYILRRLIRRAIRHGRQIGIKNMTQKISEPVFEIYNDYENLRKNKKKILKELKKEEDKFNETLERGLKIFNKISKNKKEISGKDAFLLYQSYGFPLEMTKELAKEKGKTVHENEFIKEKEKHQKLSRTTSKGKFKSGLSDNTQLTTKLHTATHLLNESIRKVLKDKNIRQKGSNISPERLRIDFNFSRKLTKEEIKKIEETVNKKINDSLKIIKQDKPLNEAIKEGAQAEFGEKYPKIVSVYTILDNSEKRGWFSKEICTGPHVKNTKEIGKIKIIKEESSSAGIRRIKAVIESS